MSAAWMGPVGLVAAAVGMVSALFGYRMIAAAIAATTETSAQAAGMERLRRLDGAAIVVGVAVAIYFGARALGQGRVGLYVCVATLVVNAAVVAALRIRWFDDLGADPRVVERHRRGALLQLAGTCIGFTGAAIYLLRP